jgi:hypothetical protein
VILQVLHALHRFDGWLDRRLGAPYRLLIGVGLVIEICRGAVEITHAAGDATYLIGTGLTLLLYAALLLHTADALYERLARRSMRRGTLPGRR